MDRFDCRGGREMCLREIPKCSLIILSFMAFKSKSIVKIKSDTVNIFLKNYLRFFIIHCMLIDRY